ncbi:hypothetical protein [Yersinia canariae]|uniref:hypothetical protein n=1 Tax=Yersinia canariae TaxID=2607663 RepID=UPI0011A579B7|nr:hypothetical protein [Yersinia canariae]
MTNELDGLYRQYASNFSALAVKKYNGENIEGQLEKLLNEALDHFKLITSIPFDESADKFLGKVKMLAQSKDGAQKERRELAAEAIIFVNNYVQKNS